MNFKRTVGIVSAISAVHYGYILIPVTRQQIITQPPPQAYPLHSPSASPFVISSSRKLRFNCSLAMKKAKRRIRLAIRLIQLSVMFGPAMMTLPLYLLRTRNLTTHMDETWWPHLLTATVQYAGPSFIKVKNNMLFSLFSSDNTLARGLTFFLEKYANYSLHFNLILTPFLYPLLYR